MYNDTIVAISTPVGMGAVGIVRLSGEKSFEIAKKLFSCKTSIDNMEEGKLYLGNLTTENFVDKCLMVKFVSPKSFTGENIVEFQCHGGKVIVESLLSACVTLGARIAENGEFSRRAFLNGKMDLTNVEGMADMINAESEIAEKLAYSQFKGGISDKIKVLQGELEDVIAYTEASFDYPEDEIPAMDVPMVRDTVNRHILELDKLINSYSIGKIIKDGVSVAILGQPNVGKSSILNSILGVERAIVSNIAGTTRDVLTASYNYKGIKFELFDTAGLRNTDDALEKMGVIRAEKVIESANVLVAVFDGSKEIDKEDLEVIEKIKNKECILVINKSDASDKNRIESIKRQLSTSVVGNKIIVVSTKNEEGVDLLKEELYYFVNKNNVITTTSSAISNERQLYSLKECRQYLINVINNLKNENADCLIIDIKNAWDKYGEITGTTATEHIIDTIFSKLCLGK